MSQYGKVRKSLNSRIPLTVLFLLLGTALVLAAAPVPAAKSLTVGEFAMLISARAHQGDPSQAPSTPEVAVASLQKAGIRIRTDLSSPFTEGDAVEVFRQFGISVQAQAPENILDRDRAASLIGIFGNNLASFAARSGVSFLSGVTESALAAPTVAELTQYDCQKLVPSQPCGGGGQASCNPCMDCCLKQLNLGGKLCGHVCQKKNLIISPSEPTP